MVKIVIKGESHLLKDSEFKELMYCARCYSDASYIEHFKMGIYDVAYKYLNVLENATLLENLIDDSEA